MRYQTLVLVVCGAISLVGGSFTHNPDAEIAGVILLMAAGVAGFWSTAA